MRHLSFLLLILFMSPVQSSPTEAKRIVFLGDSITYSGQYVAWFDAWLTVNHPDSDRLVLNLGLPSETISGLSEKGHAGGRFPRPDLHERLSRILETIKPDLVYACYGINCGIYQPFSEERFAAYRNGVEKLKRKVEATGAELILITPWIYDHARGTAAPPAYDQVVMGHYAEWLLSRKTDGWQVIDLHGTMTQTLIDRRAAEPHFTFQKDGVHPNGEGHWIATRALIQSIDPQAPATLEAYKTSLPNSQKLLPLATQRMTLLRDAWITKIGHRRPGVSKGRPLAEAQKSATEITAQIQKLATP